MEVIKAPDFPTGGIIMGKMAYVLLIVQVEEKYVLEQFLK